MLEIFSIIPPPLSAICLPKTWLGSRVPRKFKSKTNRMASLGKSKNERSGEVVASFLFPPAPLISMSIGPSSALIFLRAASRLSLSSTSHLTATAVPPSDLIRSATFLAAASIRSRTAILAPALASAPAIVPQRTPPPPVIAITLSLTSNRLFIPFVLTQLLNKSRDCARIYTTPVVISIVFDKVDVMSNNPQEKCKLSCRLEVLPGDRIIEKLTNAAAFGFDAVSLPGRFLDDYLDELRRCLVDSPLPFASMSLGFSGSLLSPDQAVRRQCRDSFLRLFDICAELGVGCVNVPPVLIEDNPARITEAGAYGSATEAQDALLVEQLPALADRAQQRGLMFLLEPVNRYESEYLNTVPHAARLCETLSHESIGLTCDFFHMQIEELSIAESLAAAAKWIRHVHVAENTRVEPGPGSLDFTPAFHTLKTIGYKGFIELECRRLSGPAGQVLPKSVEYLRQLWNQA